MYSGQTSWGLHQGQFSDSIEDTLADVLITRILGDGSADGEEVRQIPMDSDDEDFGESTPLPLPRDFARGRLGSVVSSPALVEQHTSLSSFLRSSECETQAVRRVGRAQASQVGCGSGCFSWSRRLGKGPEVRARLSTAVSDPALTRSVLRSVSNPVFSSSKTLHRIFFVNDTLESCRVEVRKGDWSWQRLVVLFSADVPANERGPLFTPKEQGWKYSVCFRHPEGAWQEEVCGICCESGDVLVRLRTLCRPPIACVEYPRDS
jgi:hypothetical protein